MREPEAESAALGFGTAVRVPVSARALCERLDVWIVVRPRDVVDQAGVARVFVAAFAVARAVPVSPASSSWGSGISAPRPPDRVSRT